MNQGRDLVQVQLACYELGWIWNYIGNDGYPAPYFDNVVVKIFPYVGPGFSFRELDIANDNFPARGTIDYADLGSHDVRFDAANNIALAADLRNDPGDSSVVDINPVRSGAEFDGMPTMHYTVDFNPVFDAFRTAGMPAVGTSEGMPAVGSDFDHRVSYAEGGATNESNADPLCRHDHCIKHQAGWTYQILPDGNHQWTSALGHTYITSRDPP